jgi:hypothetical protein
MTRTKKRKHPDTLNVGHKVFTIEQKSLKKDNLYGCVEFEKNTITIDPSQSDADYKSTLLHEIIHVGMEMFGLGEDEDIPQINNEYITSVTSNMIILLSALNQEIFTFIISNE